jgi:hypothetical protein
LHNLSAPSRDLGFHVARHLSLGERGGDRRLRKRWGMCCEQLASQAETVKTITCSERAL